MSVRVCVCVYVNSIPHALLYNMHNTLPTEMWGSVYLPLTLSKFFKNLNQSNAAEVTLDGISG